VLSIGAARCALHVARWSPNRPTHRTAISPMCEPSCTAFAEIDRSVTPELVERVRQELERQGVRGVVEQLPGVAHGFAMADLPVYDRAAAERHFERTLDLWRRNLSSEPAAI